MSIQSTLVIESSQIIATNGGPGGTGAAGQQGGAGGTIGGAGGNTGGLANLKPGCAGGRGGNGGSGGIGGNGVGGHSIGIAYTGTAPTVDSATTFTTGMQATGGEKMDTLVFP
jgi:hypothetical protein